METDFFRWMRDHPELLSDKHGIVRTDMDCIILRYKTHRQGRKFQLMIILEIKDFGAAPDDAQRDILNFLNQMAMKTSRNIHGAITYCIYKLKTFFSSEKVRVKYLGYHLLQFERTGPTNGWIKWDRHLITEETLVDLLAMNLHPYYPFRPMDEFLRDRHQQNGYQHPLFSEIETDHIKPARNTTNEIQEIAGAARTDK